MELQVSASRDIFAQLCFKASFGCPWVESIYSSILNGRVPAAGLHLLEYTSFLCVLSSPPVLLQALYLTAEVELETPERVGTYNT